MIYENILKSEEKAVFKLRSLFRQYGYKPYSMSKFEEYELYMRNKDFLVSDRIISFIDTNGKLLALKPDVTLSIIKSGEDATGCKQKVYYNENVYRISGSTHRYKEIMQAGLECIGDIDMYDIYEVIMLAAKSLALISDEFVLEISHLGVFSQVLNNVCEDSVFCEKAIHFISQKNIHDLQKLCNEYKIPEDKTETLSSLVKIYGERKSVISKLKSICDESAVAELETLSKMLNNSPYSKNIIFDFSVVNDMSYYNGFVFKGFLNGICDGVLAGGQYDKMMQKMDRKSGAIGFALYLDLLEQLKHEKAEFDVDVLLIYNNLNKSCEVAKNVDELTANGLIVSAQKEVPPALRYKELVDIRRKK